MKIPMVQIHVSKLNVLMAIIATAVTLIISAAQARVEIDVTKGNVDPLPIAIPLFSTSI